MRDAVRVGCCKPSGHLPREQIFQTDSGPIVPPDLSPERLRRGDRLAECFDLACPAFDAADWAEFVAHVPTQVGRGLAANHDSQPRRVEMGDGSIDRGSGRCLVPLRPRQS